MRILLAEDNAVNQKIAIAMFEQMGYQFDVAANGREVLDFMSREHYDAITCTRTYELISLPLYLAANVGRILRDGEPRPRER